MMRDRPWPSTPDSKPLAALYGVIDVAMWLLFCLVVIFVATKLGILK